MTEVPKRLRPNSRWRRLSHGIYVPAVPAQATDWAADAVALQRRLSPQAVYTGLTAARLWRIELPPLPDTTPIFVAMPRSAPPVQRIGIQVTRHATTPSHVEHRGARVEPVPATLLACARELGLLDLVVTVDAALHRRLCTRGDLEVAAAVRRRGAPLLRTALRYCDAGAESPWESMLRMLHVVGGVPVVSQVDLRDDHGSFVARADLLLVGTKVLHEYDGLHHRTPQGQARDLHRDRRLLAAGYLRRGYTAEDVLHRAASILREACAACGIEYSPRRSEAWHGLLRSSAFSAAGRAALEARWQASDGKRRSRGDGGHRSPSLSLAGRSPNDGRGAL